MTSTCRPANCDGHAGELPRVRRGIGFSGVTSFGSSRSLDAEPRWPGAATVTNCGSAMSQPSSIGGRPTAGGSMRLAVRIGNALLAYQLAKETPTASAATDITIRGADMTLSFDTLRIRWNS